VRREPAPAQAHTVFLDNRQMDGRPGFFVVTPLQLGPGDAVLVQRGWAPRNQEVRSTLPPVATPAGEVEVLGLIAPPPSRLYEFGHEASGPIRQNLDLAAASREFRIGLRPLSVWQLDAAANPGDGLARHWPVAAVDVSTHYGYAFQWFAFSALIAGLYVWFQLVRPRLRQCAR
jgi:surfeit locus 1 family protein